MQDDMSSGLGQANLTLQYEKHRKKGSGFKLKDLQIFFAEYLGTFILAFLIASTKTANNAILVPFAIGSGLIALIHMFGPISGGQFNPAATLALLLRYKLNAVEACYCVISQCLGALSAGMVSWFIFNGDWDCVGYPQVVDATHRPQAFVCEFLITFAFLSVALNTATTKAQANNSYFGMAIGFTVISGALVIGGVSGACFNPAIALLTVLHGRYGDLWVFMIAPLCGAVSAGLLFRVNNPSEWDEADPIGRIVLSHHKSDGTVVRLVAMLFQEFQGTFLITWIFALSSNVPDYVGPLGIVLMIIAYVYAGGSVSGAHYNPAVTVGVYLRSFNTPHHMRTMDAVLYVATQIVAAFAAADVAAYVNDGFEKIYSPAVNTHDHTEFQAFIVEFIFSSAIVLTVLFTATSENVSGNSFFGVAIGFMTLAGAVVGQNISRSIFNPASSLALAALTNSEMDDVWVYILGDLAGGIFAALLYKFFNISNANVDEKSVRVKSSEKFLRQSLLTIEEE
jgi:aquaporin Z